jgi:hypothetical protein
MVHVDIFTLYMVNFHTMRNCVSWYHTTLQLKFKNHSNTTMLQQRPLKLNSYVTTNYKYGDLINKFSHEK